MPEIEPTPKRLPFAQMIGFVALYVALDWASYIRPVQGYNITPWSPQSALAIALLMSFPRAGWLVAGALAVAEIVVRGMPSSWLSAVAGITALTLAFMVMTRALVGHRGPGLALETRRDLWRMVLVTFVGSLACGTIYLLSLKIGAVGPDGPAYRAIVQYGVGDFVGIIVVLPLILSLADRQQRANLVALLGNLAWWLTAAAVVALVYGVLAFDSRPFFNYVYILLLPVVYLSARFGLAGAVMSSTWTQFWLLLAVHRTGYSDLVVFELQALMSTIALTALLLGVTTSEQQRATARLRQTLRFAAAGQMSAALAHELGQPLTAISNYANAAKHLLEQGAPPLPPSADASADASADTGVDTGAMAPEQPLLANTLERIVAESQKVAEVVRRLRDFFQSGSMKLQPVDPLRAVNEAVAGLARRAESLQVSISVDAPQQRPLLLVDPVQLSVVLRNLVENAIDAAARSKGRSSVDIRMFAEHEQWRIGVTDSGPGIRPDRIAQVFESGQSTKAGGMGIGLSLCRSIIEAHEGRLWLEAGTPTWFWLSLPAESEQANTVSHDRSHS